MAAFSSIMLGVAIAGIGTQTVGQWKAGSAAKKQGEAAQRASESAAALDEYNAAVADLQAKDAIARGQDEASRYASEVRGVMGEQRVAFAAGGVDVHFGSAREVDEDVQRLAALDITTIEINAAREAWGYDVQAFNDRQAADIKRQEGSMYAAAGRSAQTAARIGAVAGAATSTSSLLFAKYGSGGGTKAPIPSKNYSSSLPNPFAR
jgi:hypothetical protein